ncbi:hypothetical protein [Streptomyces qinzhouensis]|uniref:Calcium-binding protein n=1 Tax=Streptomyces qinzhouensis TaxID=2599401 RepID=A0A5B8IGV2_9ACTN|nr:hypothetical protein [Streptomyces qinzhouensis]QDY77452.1 hypothetical protein FQU76_13995 [Streptomyces qinzhouensis]
MRIRTSASASASTALVAALLLTVLAAPGARADHFPPPSFADVAVNKERDVVLGLGRAGIRTTFTLYAPLGTSGVDARMWRGSSYARPDLSFGFAELLNCRGPVEECATSLTLHFKQVRNKHAGAWNLSLTAGNYDHPEQPTVVPQAARFGLFRNATLTVNATPEPVRKGNTITVKGGLRIADWDRGRYAGSPGKEVRLEFRAPNADQYQLVKRVPTDRYGNVTARVKAGADGYWRWRYLGSTTTASVTTYGDFVDVR